MTLRTDNDLSVPLLPTREEHRQAALADWSAEQAEQRRNRVTRQERRAQTHTRLNWVWSVALAFVTWWMVGTGRELLHAIQTAGQWEVRR